MPIAPASRLTHARGFWLGDIPPMPEAPDHKPNALPFSERDFYLREFRGRTIAFSGEPKLPLREVVDPASRALRSGGSRVLLLTDSASGLALGPGVEASVWRQLSQHAEAEVRIAAAPADWPRACAEAVLRLGVTKWVWLDEEGGVEQEGKRESFVNHAELKAWLRERIPS